MRIKVEGYRITGTPAEILELLDLLDGSVTEGGCAEPEPVPETPERPMRKPAAKKTTGGKKVDWAKAAALRAAGWSYDKIGDELGVSGVTVSAHLKNK